MRSVAALLVFFLLRLIAQAQGEQQTIQLDLREAIRLALEKNLGLRVEHFSPLIAEQQTRIEAGRFDPRFEASYSRGEDTDRRFLSPRGDRLNTEFDSAAAGFTGLTPLGTTYDLGIRADRTATNNGGDDSVETGLAFGLRQPLLRDFGPAANLAGLRIARVNQRASEWQLRAEAIDVITQIYYAYNDLFFEKENLAVARRSQALAQRLWEDNQRRADVGTMSPLDVTEARAEAARRQEAVILAVQAEKTNENVLKQLITDRIESFLKTRLTIAPPPSAAAFSPEVDEGIRDALTRRPDYQQAMLDLQRRKISLAFERNQALPRLDLTGSLNLLGFDSGFSESFGNTLARDRSSWSAGALFSVPIPNREGRGRVTTAQLESARALIELKRLEQDIIVRVDNARGEIVTARERIRSTSESTALARETLEGGQERLRVGSVTTFEVLELQRRLAEAEAAELRARADYNKAVAEFDRITGTAIDRNGISFGD